MTEDMDNSCRTDTIADTGRTCGAAALGMALVEGAIGYEWLISGLNKILNPHFTAGLAPMLHDAMHGNPNTWWVTLMRRLVAPNLPVFGPVVQASEVLVALGFFVGAALWLGGGYVYDRFHVLTLGVIGAILAGTTMTINYYLMAGNTLPGINPGEAFNEGLSLDGLLTLIGIGLVAAHLHALRHARLASSAETVATSPLIIREEVRRTSGIDLTAQRAAEAEGSQGIGAL